MARPFPPTLLAPLIVSALGWTLWPWLCPAGQGNQGVIAVFVEDPWRSHTALRLWRERPGSVLVFQGRDSSQRVNDEHLARRSLLPADGPDLVRLTPGCDTVEQITALADWLRRFQPPGQITLVTGQAHMGRTLAIARITLASRGWRVEGQVAPTGDNRWEQPWRTLRDQLRSQLWRATGWSGRPIPAHCT
jgi:uncharacterized SAM-binding protein YcdF (DUF218 family)